MIERLRVEEKLLVLCGATFLVMAGQGVVSPVLPLYASEFNVGTAMVGLTITTFAAARLLLNVPAGMLSDRFGRRVILIGGPAITSIGMIGSGLAGSIWTLLAWRFVAGAGSALYMGGAMVYLIDIARPDQLSRYVATNQWALSLGVSLGPGIGGLVAERWGLSAPFFVVGVTAIFASVYAFFRLPETRDRVTATAPVDTSGEDTPAATTARELLFSRPFLLLALISVTIFMTRGGTRGTLMPLHANDALGWGPSEIGLLFTLTGLMTLFTLMPAGWASDAIGRRWVILFSGVVAGAGTLLIAGSATVAAFVIGSFVLSLGTGTAGPAPAAFVADLTPPHLRGVMVGLYRSAGDIGIIAGPVLLGLVADRVSIAWALTIAGVLVAAASVAFFIGNRHYPAAGSQRHRRPQD